MVCYTLGTLFSTLSLIFFIKIVNTLELFFNFWKSNGLDFKVLAS
jgi:hypothetical protein